jgi:hypothetical protein
VERYWRTMEERTVGVADWDHHGIRRSPLPISGGTVISTGFCMSYLNATNTDNIDFYVIEDQIVTYVIVELDQIDRMSVSMEWREEFWVFEMLCILPTSCGRSSLFGSWWFPPLPSDPDAPHQIPMLPLTLIVRRSILTINRSSIVNVCEVLCVL